VDGLAAFDGYIGAHIRAGKNRDGGAADAADAGKRGDVLAETVGELNHFWRVIAAELRRNREGDDVLRGHANVLVAEIPERFGKERRGGEQEQCERHLPGDQNLAEAHVGWAG